MENEYSPFETMTFTYDKCFLCGEPLTKENNSDEHVFPKWLQHKFNLWEKESRQNNRKKLFCRHFFALYLDKISENMVRLWWLWTWERQLPLM